LGALLRALALAPLALTLWASWAVLRQAPFAEPFVARGTAELRVAMDRAMARDVTPAWLAAQIEAALAAEDPDRLAALEQAAQRAGIEPGPEQAARIAAVRARAEGWQATAAECLACMADVAACPSLRMLGACGVPFELSPLGDLNALRRAGTAALAGQEVDRLDLGLALAGLGATGTLALTGGGSASVKAGASALRLARRSGRLTPAFAGDLSRRIAALEMKPAALPAHLAGRAPLSAVLEPARLADLTALGGDLGRLVRNTAPQEALALLAHVESADDAARLARLSDAAGPATRGVMETLGKPRAFRLLVRLSDRAIGALLLLYGLALQLALALAGLAGRALLRRLAALPLA